MRIDQGSRAPGGNAARVTGRNAGLRGGIYGLKRGHPAVLGEVIVVEADADADHSVSASSGRIRHAQTGRERRAIVMRSAGDERNIQRLQSQESGVVSLTASRSGEEPESGVVAQAVVDCQMTGDSPGILCVESQPLHILRKGAIAGRRVRAGRIRRGIRAAHQILRKLLRVGQIVCWIHYELRQVFCRARKGAAQDGLVNEVNTKPWRVTAGGVAHVVTELIFLLVAHHWKSGNGRNELLVAKSFETGNSAERGAERKSQCEPEFGVTRLGVVQAAGV